MMKQVDREALERAIAMARTYSADRSEQIDWKLKEDGWRDTAEFCAYLCQCQSLRLEIIEFPPCWVSVNETDERAPFQHRAAAAKLLRRLLAAGLSRYEPDPLRALEAAEKLQAAE